MDDVDLDTVERDYMKAIKHAEERSDNDEAYWLSVGLKQYRDSFKED